MPRLSDGQLAHGARRSRRAPKSTRIPIGLAHTKFGWAATSGRGRTHVSDSEIFSTFVKFLQVQELIDREVWSPNFGTLLVSL